MNLPSYDEIECLYEKHGVLDHIKTHMRTVGRLAKHMAILLNENGVDVDIELVEKGALLHDIAKTICLNKRISHATEGQKILIEEGYSELGDIAFSHGSHVVRGENGYEAWFAQDWHHKIVALADAYVRHSSVVSLDERFEYLYERYDFAIDVLKLLKKVLDEFEFQLVKLIGGDFSIEKLQKLEEKILIETKTSDDHNK